MVDDHDLRAACAADFAAIRGQIMSLENGKRQTSEAIQALTSAMERLAASHRGDHDEAMRAISGYQGQIIGITNGLSERVALIEASARSSHHRIDEQRANDAEKFADLKKAAVENRRMVWGVVILALSSAAGTILSIIVGKL